MIQTFQDAQDNLIDYLGGGPAQQVTRHVRQAILEAYRDITNAHKWPYLYRPGRIFTQVPFGGIEVATTPAGGGPTVYTTVNPVLDPPAVGTTVNADGSTTTVSVATIQYQQSSGTYPFQVTLSGGTWPSWAVNGYLRFADTSGTYGYVAYRVAQQVSATVLTLDAELNPGADIAAGTTFILYQDTYLLPIDFMASDQALYELNIGGMSYVHPRYWLYDNRYILSQGSPVLYTITGDQQYPGRLVMRIVPWPNDTRSIDFIYARRPRPLNIVQASGGTVSVAANSSTVTCTSAAFTPAMVGSVIRISANATAPTSQIGGVAGYNPPAIEAYVMSWISPTVVSISVPSATSLSGVGWYVSDPIDFELGAMQNAFGRCAEKCIANLRNLKTRTQAMSDYLLALEQAKSASSPSFAGRRAGPKVGLWPIRLRDRGFVGPDEP